MALSSGIAELHKGLLQFRIERLKVAAPEDLSVAFVVRNFADQDQHWIPKQDRFRQIEEQARVMVAIGPRPAV